MYSLELVLKVLFNAFGRMGVIRHAGDSYSVYGTMIFFSFQSRLAKLLTDPVSFIRTNSYFIAVIGRRETSRPEQKQSLVQKFST